MKLKDRAIRLEDTAVRLSEEGNNYLASAVYLSAASCYWQGGDRFGQLRCMRRQSMLLDFLEGI